MTVTEVSGVSVTPGIRQDLDPVEWKEHLYGLTKERWDSLSGKSFWITGAGTGYGRAMSVALASAGGKVFLSGRRKEKLLESLEVMKRYGLSTDGCFVVDFDLTDIKQIKKACIKVETTCDSLYGLVNNAALPPRASLQEDTLEYWERMFCTNVTAPWLLTREIFPHMKAGGAARVLFITSEAGWAFTPGSGSYNMNKAALNNLSASMAAEYAERFPDVDLQMNALVPGEARTEMNQGSPYRPCAVVSMTLILLSHPNGGPNGRFFYRDGRHMPFTYAPRYNKHLI